MPQENVPHAFPLWHGRIVAKGPVHGRAHGLRSRMEKGPDMPKRRAEQEDAESRRILARLAGEADTGGASFIVRQAKGVKNHITAADADRSDPIEYWGTRIGRVLGLAVAVALMVWLVIFLTRGG
jgi:hypothetical protein